MKNVKTSVSPLGMPKNDDRREQQRAREEAIHSSTVLGRMRLEKKARRKRVKVS